MNHMQNFQLMQTLFRAHIRLPLIIDSTAYSWQFVEHTLTGYLYLLISERGSLERRDAYNLERAWQP